MIIDDCHFAYLRLQRGALDELSHDRAAWHEAYEKSLADDFLTMAPYLPATCRSVLDVGSGLGGIDIVLDRFYGGLSVRLIDGEDDAPKMVKHGQTFNRMDVARDFHVRNGSLDAAALMDEPRQFDLILSLQSWCFHFAPDAYLALVAKRAKPEAALIIDVRADKPEWRRQLCGAFEFVDYALIKPKFERLIFRAR